MTVNITNIVDEKYELKYPIELGENNETMILEITLKAPTPAHRELMHHTRQMNIKLSLALQKEVGDDDDEEVKKEPTVEEREAGFLQILPLLDYSSLEDWYKLAIKTKAITALGTPFNKVLEKLDDEDFNGVFAKYVSVFIMR